MREYKFRVWSEILDKMIYSKDNAIKFYDGILLSCGDICDGKVMQFTGLKDKNGKDIYEGDILQVKTYVSTRKGVVIFRKGQFAIKQDNDIIFLLSDRFWDEPERLEVIGNKYENPELSEVEE